MVVPLTLTATTLKWYVVCRLRLDSAARTFTSEVPLTADRCVVLFP